MSPRQRPNERTFDAFARFFEGHFSAALIKKSFEGDLSEGNFGGYPTSEGPGSIAICWSPVRNQHELGWIIPPVRRGASQGWIFGSAISEWLVTGPFIRIRYYHPPVVPAGDPVIATQGALNPAERVLKISMESHAAAMTFSRECQDLMKLRKDLVTVREKRPQRTIGEGPRRED